MGEFLLGGVLSFVHYDGKCCLLCFTLLPSPFSLLKISFYPMIGIRYILLCWGGCCVCCGSYRCSVRCVRCVRLVLCALRVACGVYMRVGCVA